MLFAVENDYFWLMPSVRICFLRAVVNVLIKSEKMNRIILYCMSVMLLVGCSKPPTDEQVKKLFEEVHQTLMNKSESFEENDKKVKELLDAAGEEFDVMKMQAGQFGELAKWNTLRRSKSVKEWIAPRLEQLSVRKDKEGAVAAYYKLLYNPQREKSGYSVDEAVVFLNHPAVGEIFRDETVGTSVIRQLVDNAGGEVTNKAELIRLITPCIDDRMPVELVKNSVSLFDQALRMGDQLPAEDLAALRSALMKQQERMLGLGDGVVSKWAAGNVHYMNSLIAQGKLVGGEAPAIEFLWSNTGKISSLADLKGKVVVLDFWATWCGPCVASFPNVRELQKRYKGYPVEIVGVTSLQGHHIKFVDGKREKVDTKGDPQKEMELMKEFMREMKMTWNVAFSSGNVFNPEYGVMGIPHVAIIDPAGKVRFNGLNPYDAPYHEAEKIDGLLKEAGMRCPEKAMEQKNYIKQ